jgi:hypothetical protein
VPPIFLNCDIARLNFIHIDNDAFADRSTEPPFIKPSSYAPARDVIIIALQLAAEGLLYKIINM